VYFDYKKKEIAIDIFYSPQIENIDTNIREDRYKLHLFNRENATDADKEFTKDIAKRFSLVRIGERYNSEEKSKENIVELLKEIMNIIDKQINN
jgi:hypothetical protein